MKKKIKVKKATKSSTNKMLCDVNNHPLFTILFFMIATALILGSLAVIIPHF